jgi:hypothetical protein
MSELYAYICTRTTADPYIPPASLDIRILSRDVSDAFVALSGGYVRVGEIRLFPIQRTVPFHVLCDGRELSKVSFPELYSYLGDTQGTPADVDNFVLPNFIGGSLTPAASADTETVNEGTVTSPPPSDPSIPNWYDQNGDADSGGRRFEFDASP